MSIENLLKSHGWSIECESPFEIRHAESGSFATGLAAEMVLENLSPIPAPLEVYDSSSTMAPRASAWPLERSLWQPYLGTEAVVTFTALVPLQILVESGIDGLNDYCQQAFGEGVELSHTEFRVLKTEPEDADWNDRLQGDIALQVTGTLSSSS